MLSQEFELTLFAEDRAGSVSDREVLPRIALLSVPVRHHTFGSFEFHLLRSHMEVDMTATAETARTMRK